MKLKKKKVPVTVYFFLVNSKGASFFLLKKQVFVIQTCLGSFFF